MESAIWNFILTNATDRAAASCQITAIDVREVRSRLFQAGFVVRDRPLNFLAPGD
jgi:hypothetical protein